MIKKIKKLMTVLAISGMVLLPAFSTLTVSAQTAECLDTGGGIEECLKTGAETTDPDAADEPAAERIQRIIRTVINIFSLVVGVVSVIMIIIGGLKYITSGGDSGNLSGAKNTILYAIIGLVIVALAQVIVRFVLERTTSA